MNRSLFLSLLSCVVTYYSMNAMEKYPLHRAVKKCDLELVKVLVAHTVGDAINERDYFGKIALHYAAINGHQVIAQLLLEHGAGVNVPDGFDETALHLATFWGHQEIVELINDWPQIRRQKAVEAVRTLAMASHPDLGECSPASLLGYDGSIQKMIFGYLTGQE